MNVFDRFADAAATHPWVPAFKDANSSITFGAFEVAVRKTAAELRNRGVKPGDRVLVFIPMSVDLYRVVLAIFQVGATAVFLDEWVSLERLKMCCRLADCRVFVAPFKFRCLAWFIAEIRRIPLWISLNDQAATPLDTSFVADPDHTALLTFTTGSTGVPKAAKRSHGFLNRQFEALVHEIKPDVGEVVMSNLPIVLLVNMGVAATSVIAPFKIKKPQKFKPAAVVGLMQQTGVNTLIASPYFVYLIAKAKDDISLPLLTKVFTGGGPVFPDDAVVMQQGFPQANIQVVYGATEAEPIATVPANRVLASSLSQGLCVGQPVDRIRLKIIPIAEGPLSIKNLNAEALPPGQAGEIVVSGEHVLREYWNDEIAFKANKIVDASGEVWHRTGDAGCLDEQGTLWLLGRCKHMIRREQTWISPFIIEGLLRQIAGVVSGAVLEKNRQLWVVAVAGQGVDTDALEQKIRQILPFAIDRLVWVNRLPRDPRHFTKIDYEKLKETIHE